MENITRPSDLRPTATRWSGLSAADRNRTSIAPMVADQGSALPSTGAVVVFDALAGIRSWSPPV